MLSDEIQSDYDQLTKNSGMVVLSGRTLIQITGKDREFFLHNFCTADTKNLEPGNLTEAFVLNTKGKLLGHVFLIATESQILLSTVAGQFDVLNEHLEKYIVREDVQLVDVSNELTTVFVCGPAAQDDLRQVCELVPAKNGVASFNFADQAVVISHLELAGDGFMFVLPRSANGSFIQRLREIGIHLCSEKALSVVRIENATPWFAIDASENNLPQELCRDEQAISFNKGCYLGQETVARIDAIGHVNQLFVSFQLSDPVAAGSELTSENKTVGRLTSVCWSPQAESWIGLGFLKRLMCKPGIEVKIGNVRAKVKM